MSQWRIKCAKLTEAANQNSTVILDLCAQIHLHTTRLHEDVVRFTEDEARDMHNKLASLTEQLDQILPRINTLARTARNIK